MQGIKFVGAAVGALPAEQAIDQAEHFGRCRRRFGVARLLAHDVARKTPESGAQAAHAGLGLAELAAMMQARRFPTRGAGNPAVGQAARDAVLARHLGQRFDSPLPQLAVCRIGNRLRRCGGVDGGALVVLLRPRASRDYAKTIIA